MNRTRLLLVIAFVVVIVVAVVAFVLLGQDTGGGGGGSNQGGGVAQESTRVPPSPEPQNTPLPTPTPIPFIEVVIAIQDIPRGNRISPDAVRTRAIPEQSAPFQAFTDPNDVIGLIARTDIYREQPIQTNLLVEDFGGLADIGSDVAAVLAPNEVAVAVPADRLTTVAYALQPGDRVDIIISMLFIDVDPTFQSEEPSSLRLLTVSPNEDGTLGLNFSAPIRGSIEERNLGRELGLRTVLIEPSEDPRPRLSTQRTIQDARVLWTGNFPIDGRIFRPAPTITPTPDPEDEEEEGEGQNQPQPTPVPPRPDIITLGVSPQEAVVLTWMVEAGLPITFALRSASATSLVNTEPVTLDYILTRFSINVPEEFTYNIEPAIRSIRELSVGNRIQLGG